MSAPIQALPYVSNCIDICCTCSTCSASPSAPRFSASIAISWDLEKARASTPEEIRRQAIVVLSDGEDTSSLIAFEDVLDLAKRSHTSIYAIGIRENTSIPDASSRRSTCVTTAERSMVTTPFADVVTALLSLPVSTFTICLCASRFASIHSRCQSKCRGSRSPRRITRRIRC